MNVAGVYWERVSLPCRHPPGVVAYYGRRAYTWASERFELQSDPRCSEVISERALPPRIVVPRDLIVETDALMAAPLLLREPYRVLFPLGAVLGFAGVAHWLLHALGVLADFRPVFHTVTQIQGFLMCFALGFLLTMLPRRTGSAPPSTFVLAVALVAPPLTVGLAWAGAYGVAQIVWLALAVVVVVFAVRRFLSASSRRRPPNAFVWVPIAFLIGIAGSVMVQLAERLGPTAATLGLFGRGLLQQGMFLALVLGVGSLALPLMMRGAAPRDGDASLRDRSLRLFHLAGGGLLVVSFWIGVASSARVGFLLRAAVLLAVLLTSGAIWRGPRPAWNARVIWIASWLLPLGYLISAIWPKVYRAGLHVSFIGGFSLMSLAVSTQVVLGHGGRSDLMLGRPKQVFALASLILLAIIPRALMEVDPRHYFLWMFLAAGCFLGGLLVWGAFLVPKLLRPPDPTTG